MIILAKEIARVMLGQLQYSERPDKDEHDALELIRTWGFDPELYRTCTALTRSKNQMLDM